MKKLSWILVVWAWHASFPDAAAYNLFGPYDWGGDLVYPKWGDIHAGTPGGTVEWSIIPDGTPIDPLMTDPNITGTSSFNALIDGLGRTEALAAIERVFQRWSDAANIYFVEVPDSGEPWVGPGAIPPTTGRLRIGAYAIAGSVGAVGFAAPPNGGTTLEGDVIFNSNSLFQFAAGAEGDLIDFYQPPTFFFHNDFEGLLLHEVGHTLGLAHSDVCSVMSVDFDCYKFLNRIPDPDDVAAVQFLYGPALAADFDRNNGVASGDLANWKSGLGTASGAAKTSGDADKDGDVDGADLLAWQRELGSGSVASLSVSAAVPEPSATTLWLLAVGGLAAFELRKQRCARVDDVAAVRRAP
jgi:hypothetical protein